MYEVSYPKNIQKQGQSRVAYVISYSRIDHYLSSYYLGRQTLKIYATTLLSKYIKMLAPTCSCFNSNIRGTISCIRQSNINEVLGIEVFVLSYGYMSSRRFWGAALDRRHQYPPAQDSKYNTQHQSNRRLIKTGRNVMMHEWKRKKELLNDVVWCQSRPDHRMSSYTTVAWGVFVPGLHHCHCKCSTSKIPSFHSAIIEAS